MAADFTTSKVSAGETSSSSKFDAFVQAVQDALNAIGDTTKMGWSAGTIIDPNQIKQSGATSGQALCWSGSAWAPATVGGGGGGTTIPAGVIEMYGGGSAPSGWLLCDGTAVSRATYSALFTAISTTFGNGDGATTFNVPDLRGRMPVGLASGGDARVNGLNDNDGLAFGLRTPHHTHTVTDPGHHHIAGGHNDAAGGSSKNQMDPAGSEFTGVATTGIVVGVSTPVDTPAYIVLNFIVKT